MSVEDRFENAFKSEVRSAGRRLVAQEKVSVASASDTQIQAYVRSTPPLRVTFSAVDIGSESFVASCSCPAAVKRSFCKHVWATLLWVNEKYPDFLVSKCQIEKSGEGAGGSQETAQKSYQATAKIKAAEYRKEQYKKQKQRAKKLKAEACAPLPSYPLVIEAALNYFTENGFPMPQGPSESVLSEAKRKLSRVFHPDKGGSHAESVELNRNYELLMRFLRT